MSSFGVLVSITNWLGFNLTFTKCLLPSSFFNEFAKFYTIHPEVFSSEVKERMLNTAVDIVKIFKADNPHDNTMMKALRDLVEPGKVKV